MRAVLWVSADGLRVVDDKTKVTSPFSPVMSDQNNEQPEAVIKAEAAALWQLMTVKLINFWSGDLQKAPLWKYRLGAPAGADPGK